MNWLMDRWEAPTRFVAQMVVVASVGLLAGGLAAPVAVAEPCCNLAAATPQAFTTASELATSPSSRVPRQPRRVRVATQP